MTFHHGAQILERIQLDLADAFAGYANFLANLLQGLATIAMQAESALDDCALFFAQLAHPVIDDIVNRVLLRTARRLGIALGP